MPRLDPSGALDVAMALNLVLVYRGPGFPNLGIFLLPLGPIGHLLSVVTRRSHAAAPNAIDLTYVRLPDMAGRMVTSATARRAFDAARPAGALTHNACWPRRQTRRVSA